MPKDQPTVKVGGTLDSRQALANAVVGARTRRAWTQADVTRHGGPSAAVVSQIESANADVLYRPGTLARLDRAFRWETGTAAALLGARRREVPADAEAAPADTPAPADDGTWTAEARFDEEPGPGSVVVDSHGVAWQRAEHDDTNYAAEPTGVWVRTAPSPFVALMPNPGVKVMLARGPLSWRLLLAEHGPVTVVHVVTVVTVAEAPAEVVA